VLLSPHLPSQSFNWIRLSSWSSMTLSWWIHADFSWWNSFLSCAWKFFPRLVAPSPSCVQESPGVFIPCCIVPPADIRVMKVCSEDQGLQMWGSSHRRSHLLSPGLVAYNRYTLQYHLYWSALETLLETSRHFSCSPIERATLYLFLPNLSFLKSLYPSIAALQSCELFYHIFIIPTRS